MNTITRYVDIDSAKLVILRSGALIEAFGERGCYPDIRGIQHLSVLLTQPCIPITAVELLHRAMRDKGVDPEEIELPPIFDPTADCQALSEIRERIAELEDLEPRSFSQSEELLSLYEWLASSTSYGRPKDMNNRRRWESARSSTTANIRRVFGKLRRSGLKATARHLEQSISYKNWSWVYMSRQPTWEVEHDL